MMAYNIMALFKHEVLNSNMMLSTLRSYCFALGSWITEHANIKTLKISLPQKRRAWMDGLFENVKQSQLPFKYENILWNYLLKIKGRINIGIKYIKTSTVRI